MKVRTIFPFLALLICTACSDERHAPGEARPDPLEQSEYPQVAALEGLRNNVVVANVVENAGPPLAVDVALRNRTEDTERHVQYRFFFDEQGRPQNAAPTWQYLLMPARTQVFVHGNALVSAAKSWRLEIRPGR